MRSVDAILFRCNGLEFGLCRPSVLPVGGQSRTHWRDPNSNQCNSQFNRWRLAGSRTEEADYYTAAAILLNFIMALSIVRSNSANLIRQQWRTSIRQATTKISLQCNTITLKRFMLSAASISAAHPSVPSSTTAIPSPSSSQPGELDPDSPSPSSPSSPRTFTLTVDRHDRGMRFDRWLRSQLDDPQKMSQGQIQKLCRKGVIRRRVNKSNLTLSSALDESPSLPSDRSKVDPSDRLLGGDTFILPLWMKENILTPESKVMIDPKTHCRLNEFEKMELIESILYEDEDICILNKPSGLAVHRE